MRSQSPSVLTTRVPHPGAGQHRGERLPLLLRRGGEAAAQHCARGVHAQLAAGLGIDEPQLARVGQLLLARVADLDADHLVPARDLEQRRGASRGRRGSPR